jgi:competence protein ComEA
MFPLRSLLLALAGTAALLGMPQAAAQSATRVVNINTADAATLARELVGVGESRAAAIVAYRNQNGPFRSVEELTLVRGIGPRVIEQNRAILRAEPLRRGAAAARSPAAGAGSAASGSARKPAAPPPGR